MKKIGLNEVLVHFMPGFLKPKCENPNKNETKKITKSKMTFPSIYVCAALSTACASIDARNISVL